VEIAGSRVIAQALPGVQNVRFSRSGKRADGGEAAQPPIIVRDNSGGLGLLEHDFGNQDGIGIAALAPGEIAFVEQKPAI
jgi:hypothetical protein